MIRVGILQSGDPVELIEGWLVQKMSKNPSHRIATSKLGQILSRLVPDGWYVQQQDPITLSESEPEPDIAIIRGIPDDYYERHPGADDVALVVEVSDATINRDQGTKKRMYAEGQIKEYWLVNLIENRLEVYSQPYRSTTNADYEVLTIYAANEALPLKIDGLRIEEIRVSDILPSQRVPSRK